jgi:hypothetical protein
MTHETQRHSASYHQKAIVLRDHYSEGEYYPVLRGGSRRAGQGPQSILWESENC